MNRSDEAMPNASAVTQIATDARDPGDSDKAARQRSVGIWWLLLLLVILLGYLSVARKDSLGRLVEQITDIVRDFRGYDPEF